ncbi:unnamed protein product, partial [Bubo scandiacus]
MVTFTGKRCFSHRSKPYVGRHSSILKSLWTISRLPKFNFSCRPLLFPTMDIQPWKQ